MTTTQFQILQDRLAQVMRWPLKSGNHVPNDDGAMCVMEAAAYVAGEPWADHPQCACPTLTEFMIAWNDSLPSDDERDRLLKPLIPQLVNSRGSKAVAERRSYLALDWLIRVHTPKWLDLVPALHERAKELRTLPEITDMTGATAAGERVRLARIDAAAAWAAAWDAAGDAARDAALAAAGDAARDAALAAAGDAAGDAALAAALAAAWAAARAAAWAAAWDAAGDAARDAALAAALAAARDAARDAAWDAALAAARAAARDAARDALNPTKEWLQTSALHLFERMLAVRS